MNGWLVAWGLAVSVLAIAGWLVARHELIAGQNAKAQRDKLNTENDILHKAHAVLEEARKQSYAENADLREALQEAQAEIKSLNMNTVEVPEVAPVKRTRKKAGTQ